MFSAETSTPGDFLVRTKLARQERAVEKRREDAAVRIQAMYRSYRSRKETYLSVRNEFDKLLGKFVELDKTLSLPNATCAYSCIRHLLFVFNSSKDKERFNCVCRYLVLSIDVTDEKLNFASLALNKDYLKQWVETVKEILWKCCLFTEDLKLDLPSESKHASLYLHVLVSYTNSSNWCILKSKSAEPLKPIFAKLCANILAFLTTKGLFTSLQLLLRKGLARKQPLLKHAALSAIVSLSMRALINAEFKETTMNVFCARILSTPAIVLHLQSTAQECLALLMTHKMFVRCTELLTSERNTREVFDMLEGSYALCLLANLIHLAYMEKGVLVEYLVDFTNVVTRLLEKCRLHVVSKKSVVANWHPVLGWFSHPVDTGLYEAMPNVVKQLQMLWNADAVKCLFADLMTLADEQNMQSEHEQEMAATAGTSSARRELVAPVRSALVELTWRTFYAFTETESGSVACVDLFKKILEQRNNSVNKDAKKFGTPQTTIIALVCSLYQNALQTLTQLRWEILSGLSYQDFLLPRLWYFISSLGALNGVKAFLDLLATSPKAANPEFDILMLFCDTATYLLTILDDVELHEQQRPFSHDVLAQVAQFTNVFVFRAIWEGLIDVKSASSSPLFQSVHTFLTLLFNRDSRRSFTRNNQNFWLIKELKPSAFLAELEKAVPKAEFLIQKAPHIIPHKERVILFRKYVMLDRESLGLTSDAGSKPTTLITVFRSRMVEDGYRQLSRLADKNLKGIIRVKFVNEQGLDEPGIDQDGVFKEFLEEIIKRVFDPSLNLFKVTSDSRLYPSNSSNVHENHLALFDFVGRMLGKAVYEGIVVEVPFATFVLNHLLGRASSVTYSSFDELPSLDAELYKSLTYIKHYDGDVSELDLTFSLDEDFMGQMVTHELVPGGRTIGVCNENKISYVHHLARFRMYTQIKDQLMALNRGFRAIVRPEWLALFSASELQKLISGDTQDIDLEDLKKNVQYYGGFHSSHKVITWLWDIVENEFNAEERQRFLKFVTSCSKPPLLGFAHLEPPFSIRCVEVCDDQDTGDTFGSVIRGFLAIRRRDPVGRLPTSSTCFNLLKLPNYQKKATLRDKLRYAITNATGFELS